MEIVVGLLAGALGGICLLLAVAFWTAGRKRNR